MSHELTKTAGRIEMAYTGETPWHGLGQKLDENAPISSWIEAAGMNWTIGRAPMLYLPTNDSDPFLEARRFDNREIFYRQDTMTPLGHGTDKFEIVQPAEVVEFFADLVDGAGFKMHTAGTLFGGKKFWALASIGEEAEVGAGDKVGGFMLLSTGCDGATATEARFTSIRVVCNNTLSAALGGKAALKVNHRTTFLPGDVKAKLGLKVRERFGSFMDQMRHLAREAIGSEMARAFTVELLTGEHDTMTQEARAKVLRSSRASRIMELFDGAAIGAELDGVKGTKWGFLNACTQYFDHEAKANSADRRLDSAWFGSGAEMKDRALEMLLA